MADRQYQGTSPEISLEEFNNWGRPRNGSNVSERSDNGNGVAQVAEAVARNHRPSIRIRRTNSNIPQPEPNAGRNNGHITIQEPRVDLKTGKPLNTGRSRSSSAPLRVHIPGEGGPSELPDVAEETFSPTDGKLRNPNNIPNIAGARDYAKPQEVEQMAIVDQPSTSRWPQLRRRTRTGTVGSTSSVQPGSINEREYDTELVDLLDLVDPEVSTLSTLTNVQNSLFIPDLGKYLNRRPTYNLTRPMYDSNAETTSSDDDGGETRKAPSIAQLSRPQVRPQATRVTTGATLNTMSSNVNEKYYAVLPHGVSLPGWSEEEKLELNDHVRHMLHSKRSKFKRGMKGFGQYFRTPLGAFVTIYATLITLFGTAWVLFLIGWVNVGGKKDYIVNIIDNVLVALFAIMGDGLAPFRCIDTYHMIFIAHYHHLTWRLRKEQALPKLNNKNDLPAVQPEELEAQSETQDDVDGKAEFSVLQPYQVKKLAHHQKKFARSHSFYKPHETSTHHAFPLRLLVAIVVLLDCHSMLQISLGACTWGINYKVRPFALTTVILCCSITCNITAGILITIGDHKTRKKDVKERMFRQELTAEAMKKMNKEARKKLEETGELNGDPNPPEEIGVLKPLEPLAELEIGELGVDQEKAYRERREKAAETEPFPNLTDEEGPTPPRKD